MRFRFSEDQYLDTKKKLQVYDTFLMGKGKDKGKPKFNLLAFDTETNGLEFHKNVIIGFSISTCEDDGIYVPLLEWVPKKESLKTRTVDKEKVESYMEGHFKCPWTGDTYPENVSPKEYEPPEVVTYFLHRWISNSNLLMHNAPFDCNMVAYNFRMDIAKNLFCDTLLLKHIIDENTSMGLKETAEAWKESLGFDLYKDAAIERKELGASIIKNGGTFNMRTKHIWRGDPYPLGKYAAKDTALTFAVFKEGMKRLETEYSPEQVKWFFEDEVMPLCKEVMTPMKYLGIYTDTKYFEDMHQETENYLETLEDRIITMMGDRIKDFSIGKSIDEAVSQKRLLNKIIELENLKYPTKETKGVLKKSLAKDAVKKAYAEDPHWLWGYILGEDEIKYSAEKVDQIKQDLYIGLLGRRHRFNIRSDAHLRWLFCDKLGHDKTKLPQTDSATKDNPIPSMKAEVLKDHFLKDYDFVQDLLTYKKLYKLLSTYIEPAVRLHNNGWLHMNFKQHGTTSGRLACSGGFNLQTLPRVEEINACTKCGGENEIVNPIRLLADTKCCKCGNVEQDVICSSAIKKGFTAPPGYKIVNADYSSLEPRCFAYMSGDEKLKAVYWDDLDLYSKVYCDMLREPYRDLKKSGEKSTRDMIKPVVLGIPYGARAPQVARLMDLKKPAKDYKTGKIIKGKEVLDIQKGQEYLDLYLNAYPGLRGFMVLCESECLVDGFVETLAGRRRHYRYAPLIDKVINKLGLSQDEFLDLSRKKLNSPNIEDVGFGLKEDILKDLVQRLNLKWENCEEKGYWGYIRHMYKEELNNSKNFKIQGLAAHITNKAMLDTTRFFRQNGIDGYVCLQVHDEITCYVKEDQAKDGAALLKRGMEENDFTKLIDIKMIADPIICDNLKESK